MEHVVRLKRRVRVVTGLFILALVVSGLSAIPLESEIGLLTKLFGVQSSPAVPNTVVVAWLLKVHSAIVETNTKFPFLAYGMDWLAFGHFVIAIAFVGALREPVQNRWLFDFGLIACVLVVPYAMICGALRGIPLFWRLIDCSFGVLGCLPLWLCRSWVKEISRSQAGA